MGYVIVRHRASGCRRYTAMYRDVREKLRSADTFTTEKQANGAWQKAEVAIAWGRIGDPRRGRQRFADCVRVEWFPNHVIELSTRQNWYDLGRDRRLGIENDTGKSVALHCGSRYPFAQVWVPRGQPFVALEPMAAPTNALVERTAPLVEPGDTFTATSG
jgi:hypothetical protein